MYALCGKLIAQPGKRKQFAEILLRAAARVGELPGCRLYLVHEDQIEPETIWVYELWDSKQAHDDSLQDAQVRQLIGEAHPLIGGPPSGTELHLVGGHGAPAV